MSNPIIDGMDITLNSAKLALLGGSSDTLKQWVDTSTKFRIPATFNALSLPQRIPFQHFAEACWQDVITAALDDNPSECRAAFARFAWLPKLLELSSQNFPRRTHNFWRETTRSCQLIALPNSYGNNYVATAMLADDKGLEILALFCEAYQPLLRHIPPAQASLRAIAEQVKTSQIPSDKRSKRPSSRRAPNAVTRPPCHCAQLRLF